MTAELLGYRVGITSHRRADELASVLERHGAEVVHAPALQVGPVEDDAQLLADTRAILEQRPDVVVVTTGYGIKRWRQAAEAHGLGEQLTALLTSTRILCRGGKARGEVVAGGLPDCEALGGFTSQVVDRLLDEGVAGKQIAVQLHGLGDQESVDRLLAAGAQVRTVVPYTWVDADDGERLPDLIRQVATHDVHLVTFTVAAAVDALLSTATGLGLAEEVTDALRTRHVIAAAVGPVTAVPLEELGVTPVMPERFKLGALAKELCRYAAEQMTVQVPTAAGLLGVRGSGFTLDERLVPASRAALRVLRQLVRQAGEQLTRDRLVATTELDADRVRAALDELGALLPDDVLEHDGAGARLVPQATPL